MSAFDWQDRAACKGKPDEWFFSGSSPQRQPARDPYAQGRVVCASCPVSVECLAFALSNREPLGLWGGRDERERRALLRKRGG